MKELYEQNKQIEAEESCEIKFISENDLLNEYLEKESNFWVNLTPAAKACLELYFAKYTS